LNIVYFGLNPQRTGECTCLRLTLPTEAACLPFGRITGIRFFGYDLSPLFYGTPCLSTCKVMPTFFTLTSFLPSFSRIDDSKGPDGSTLLKAT
jgi:hypothetical protein